MAQQKTEEQIEKEREERWQRKRQMEKFVDKTLPFTPLVMIIAALILTIHFYREGKGKGFLSKRMVTLLVLAWIFAFGANTLARFKD